MIPRLVRFAEKSTLAQMSGLSTHVRTLFAHNEGPRAMYPSILLYFRVSVGDDSRESLGRVFVAILNLAVRRQSVYGTVSV